MSNIRQTSRQKLVQRSEAVDRNIDENKHSFFSTKLVISALGL